MNKKPVLYKKLVVGVIVLFIGVGIQPAVAVTQDSDDNDDVCDICAKKVSKSHLILIESLLNRLEKYKNQFSAISKLNSRVGKDERPFYCDILDIIFAILGIHYLFLDYLLEVFYDIDSIYGYIELRLYLKDFILGWYLLFLINVNCYELPK